MPCHERSEYCMLCVMVAPSMRTTTLSKKWYRMLRQQEEAIHKVLSLLT